MVREAVRQLPADPTITQKAVVISKWQGLQSKIQKHQDEADSFLDGVDIMEYCQPTGTMDDAGFFPTVDGSSDCQDEEEQDQEDEYIDEEDFDEVVPPEEVCIWMPSRLKANENNELGLGHLVDEELEL
jgi:hypothetical protein